MKNNIYLIKQLKDLNISFFCIKLEKGKSILDIYKCPYLDSLYRIPEFINYETEKNVKVIPPKKSFYIYYHNFQKSN
jgi:hypothetical protein